MADQTFLQNFIIKDFILPFLLMFFIVFAILEKTKVLGSGNKQVNAFVSAVIALIFVSAIYPKQVVNNLILFLTIAIIVVFIFLLLLGFTMGNNDAMDFFTKWGGLKWAVLGVVFVAIVAAVIWAMGLNNTLFNSLFRQSWSSTVWTNVLFVAVIVVALAVLIRKGSS